MPCRYPRQCRQAERFDGDFLRRRRVSEHVHAFHVGRRGFPYRNSFFRRSNRCRVATPGNAGKQGGVMGVSHVGVECWSTYMPSTSAAADPPIVTAFSDEGGAFSRFLVLIGSPARPRHFGMHVHFTSAAADPPIATPFSDEAIDAVSLSPAMPASREV